MMMAAVTRLEMSTAIGSRLMNSRAHGAPKPSPRLRRRGWGGGRSRSANRYKPEPRLSAPQSPTLAHRKRGEGNSPVRHATAMPSAGRVIARIQPC